MKTAPHLWQGHMDFEDFFLNNRTLLAWKGIVENTMEFASNNEKLHEWHL